jgi:hypothetical protein
MIKNCKEFYLKYYLKWPDSKKFQIYPGKKLNDNWGHFTIPDQVLDLENQSLFIVVNPP